MSEAEPHEQKLREQVRAATPEIPCNGTNRFSMAGFYKKQPLIIDPRRRVFASVTR
jgi:hypothetical protein